MKTLTPDSFGLLIAYLLPGFVTLWALRPFVPEIGTWLGATPATAPTIDGFLYATLASTAVGLVVSAVRWGVIDSVYHRTGIPAPDWNFRSLPGNLAAFESHVQDHYRYYQFYANMLVALLLAYGTTLATESRWPGQSGWRDVAIVTVLALLVLGSRDTLRKYYRRTEVLLEPAAGTRTQRHRRTTKPPTRSSRS